MRIRHAVVAAPLLMLSFVALAQPKRAVKDNGENKSASSAALDKEPKPPASAVAVTPSDTLGAAPPKPASEEEQTKLSPLNPEANEFADAGRPTPALGYDQLLGDIATLRSRVSALTTTLFASKLRVVVETRGTDARIASFTLTLDDGVVFTAPSAFIADDERTLYEHSLAPGHHVLGVNVERFDPRAKDFRSFQSSRFSVLVPENRRLDAHLIVEDSSDMAKNFPDDQDGEYDLRVRLRARVEE